MIKYAILSRFKFWQNLCTFWRNFFLSLNPVCVKFWTFKRSDTHNYTVHYTLNRTKLFRTRMTVLTSTFPVIKWGLFTQESIQLQERKGTVQQQSAVGTKVLTLYCDKGTKEPRSWDCSKAMEKAAKMAKICLLISLLT